jgi:hypothetical protein
VAIGGGGNRLGAGHTTAKVVHEEAAARFIKLFGPLKIEDASAEGAKIRVAGQPAPGTGPSTAEDPNLICAPSARGGGMTVGDPADNRFGAGHTTTIPVHAEATVCVVQTLGSLDIEDASAEGAKFRLAGQTAPDTGPSTAEDPNLICAPSARGGGMTIGGHGGSSRQNPRSQKADLKAADDN